MRRDIYNPTIVEESTTLQRPMCGQVIDETVEYSIANVNTASLPAMVCTPYIHCLCIYAIEGHGNVHISYITGRCIGKHSTGGMHSAGGQQDYLSNH